ncbi:hypothetical protein L873DRAFT_1833339 [Choiromyces venosus 120613-1]|uniref:Extracellular membrane protein CFEM domain-containing protein n=1 Tax=Choiromyces venosus 120613-1 TaxID=1336337 RepID=A0A3N4KDH0_9PEZI|nr:hypothetical protein L873DRAFT_1833339 [Choiromyces venosus 120613-1]
MMDFQFKWAGGILCLMSLISSLTSGAGVKLRPRNADVDFSKMPECASRICTLILGALLHYGQRITTDCFCGRPNPLVCAWSTTQCPGKPLVDISGIPSCARNCFNGANICPTLTSNCICSQKRPDCNSVTTTCDSNEVGVYDAWYIRSCSTRIRPPTGTPSTTGLSPTTPDSTGPSSAAPTNNVTFLLLRRKRENADAAASSGHGTGIWGFWNTKAKTEVAPIVVQPTPLVEAPSGDNR